jgi:hypothetical protein
MPLLAKQRSLLQRCSENEQALPKECLTTSHTCFHTITGSPFSLGAFHT